jgi:hypothetical protein
MTEFQFLKSIFYTLKRTYPRQIKLINKLDHEVDIVTGIVTDTPEELTIRRAVVIHRKETSLIQKLFGHDASERIADRYVLIDRKDLRSFTVNNKTTVEYDDEYWSIVEQSDYSKVIVYLALSRITGDVGPDTPEPLDTGPFEVVI